LRNFGRIGVAGSPLVTFDRAVMLAAVTGATASHLVVI